MEDEVILVKSFLKSGSESIFRKIYSKYGASLYRLAFFMSDTNEEFTADLIQETWITALQKLDTFKGESTLKTWLTGILLNKCREKRREKNHHLFSIEDFSEMENYSFSNITSYDLQNALAKMPLGYRVVIVMHDLEGYTHKDIANALEIAEGTSKSQLFHARKLLRKIIKDYQYER